MKRFIAIFLTTSVFILGVCSSPVRAQGADDATAQLQKFNQFFRIINAAYVDTVKNDVLIEAAIREVLQQLDPHSTFVTAEEMIGVRESFDGSFSGIGIEYSVHNDTIMVVNVIAGGPSEKVGLLPNDRIITVDGKNVVGVKQVDVPKLLRGPKGSKVELTVLRGGKEQIQFTIIRDNIPINTIDAAYKIDANTGYIKVNRFANNTFTEFLEAFHKLGGVNSLILDLRGNGGGLLDKAIELSNFFLPKGSVIVSTEGMRVPADIIRATTNGEFIKGKVIILVNETSASGSEIVAGAIQDWDRGLIVGRRTFGKGLVQRQFPFQDGSAMRLTIARYHTPTGRVIQRPYQMGQKDAYFEDFAKMFAGDDKPAGDTTKQYTTLLSGRTVFGGGGIYPDVYVNSDTSSYTQYWANLVRKGIISDFVVGYMDKNRTTLMAKYPNVQKFQSDFVVDEQILNQLVELGAAKGVEPNTEELNISKKNIKTQLKALIAQKMWGVNEYFYISNPEDEIYNRALEVLKNWDKYGKGITM